MKNIVILGSTGSIGTNTLDIVDRFPEEFRVVGLTAGSNNEKLEEQVAEISASHGGTGTRRGRGKTAGTGNRNRCRCRSTGRNRRHHPRRQASEAELVISSIVGAAGLVPTLAAITSGKHIALANKEPMVMAGKLMQAEARRHRGPNFSGR